MIRYWVAAALAAGAADASAADWTLIDLGTLGGTNAYASAVSTGGRIAGDIDEHGQRTGASQRCRPIEDGGDIATGAEGVGEDQTPAATDAPRVAEASPANDLTHGLPAEHQTLRSQEARLGRELHIGAAI